MIEEAFKSTRIEFRKQGTSSAFWILLALHSVVILLVAININGLLKNANIAINDMPQLDFSVAPILQFPDIWQNLTYIAAYFKIILALIIIISVCNDFTYSTARQNISNGLSRKEWILSKVFMATILALYSTVFVIVVGFFLGIQNTDLVALNVIIGSVDFILAYLVELTVYFIYALFLALLFRRTGIALILLIVYDFIIEPIVGWSIPDAVYQFMPMNTLDSLNTFPFPRYVGADVQSFVSVEQFVWALSYGILFTLFSYIIFKRRDL